MHAGNGGDQAQPEAGAGVGAAFLQADETLQGALAVRRGDAGPAVSDGDLDGVAHTRERDADLGRWRIG